MKNIINVLDNDTSFNISDISLDALKIFGLEKKDYTNLKNMELAIPFLVSYLNLLKHSTTTFIEFLYNIDNIIYKFKIVKEPLKNKEYIIYFEDTSLKIKTQSVTESFVKDYLDFTSTDKNLLDILDLQNKDSQTINLEVIYLLKNIQEELKQLKIRDEEHENQFIEKKEFSIFYVIEKLGIRNLILFLFVISLIESFILEPLILPIGNQLKENIQESIIKE